LHHCCVIVDATLQQTISSIFVDLEASSTSDHGYVAKKLTKIATLRGSIVGASSGSSVWTMESGVSVSDTSMIGTASKRVSSGVTRSTISHHRTQWRTLLLGILLQCGIADVHHLTTEGSTLSGIW